MKTNAMQRREVMLRVNRLMGDLKRLQHRIQVLLEREKAQGATPAPRKTTATKAATKGRKASSKKGGARKGLVGAVIPYMGTRVKVVEVNGQTVKAKFLATPTRGKGKKGAVTKIARFYVYRLKNAA